MVEAVKKILRVGVICQHALDLGSRCVLVLLANADLKADITLFISKKSCSFNTLTRVGARALHSSKIKDQGEQIKTLSWIFRNSRSSE